MMTNDTEQLILSEIKEIRSDIKEIKSETKEIKSDISLIKQKQAGLISDSGWIKIIFGAAFSAIVVLLSVLITVLFKLASLT